MKLDYYKYLIKNFCFNFVLINTLFFFPLSAIGNRLIINFELDGYIELYCLFIISISLPLSIIFFACEEISKLVKKN